MKSIALKCVSPMHPMLTKNQSLKNQNFKNPKRSFVRTIGNKIQAKFENPCRRSSVLKFSLLQAPMLTQMKKGVNKMADLLFFHQNVKKNPAH